LLPGVAAVDHDAAGIAGELGPILQPGEELGRPDRDRDVPLDVVGDRE